MATSPLKIQNILKQQTHINQQLFQAASTSNTIPDTIPAKLHKNTQQIEAICTKHQLTPTALAKPSRNAYTWMKFLTNPHNLQLHFDTLSRSIALNQEIIKPQGSRIFIEFTHSSHLYKFRTLPQTQGNHLTTLSISEIISKILDHEKIPQYLVEFILYHELLHKHHGIQWLNGKCMVHTPEFKHSERKFSQIQAAEAFLKKMSQRGV